MQNQILLCIWWVLENGIIHYFAFDFLLWCTKKNGKNWIILWITINAFIAVAVTYYQISGTFLFDLIFLFLFSKLAVTIKPADMIAPSAIIFTLYTLMEGISAVMMAEVSRSITSPQLGTVIQIIISAFLAVLFVCSLYRMKKKYAATLQNPIASYLYILLLPYSLMILVIRYGLQLDNSNFEQYLSSLGFDVRLMVFLSMAGAAVVVFAMINIFCKIIYLSEKEKMIGHLQIQLNSQKIYIDEAQKRSSQYASFQHDIRNHLLVLSGLLHSQQFTQAEQYTQKLHKNCAALFPCIVTGKTVLDILLNEKLNYARNSQIETVCSVSIPADFEVDDLDLCVLFANIMDNAITACIKESDKRFLSLKAKTKADFLIIESVNTAAGTQTIQEGTGLSNIRHIAEKYQGTMETELKDNHFQIHVLLCSK